MHSEQRRQILVVAHRSVATPALVEELRSHAHEGNSDIALLIPDAGDPAVAGWTLKRAARMFGKEVGAPVEGLMAQASDPFEGSRPPCTTGPTTRSSSRRCRPPARPGSSRSCPSGSAGSARP